MRTQPLRNPLRTPFVPVVALFAVVLAPLAHGLERFDFDQRYLIQPGYIIKDHAVVQKDGVVHVFYIKADETVSVGETAKSLGHATTTDFIHWTFHPDVVHTVLNTWEESFIWAPNIVWWKGRYHMFYTGVNRHYSQAIGLATSTDLFTWRKSPQNPVYTPDQTWAAWSSTAWSNCRDPFLFWDNEEWHLLTTTHTKSLQGAISHARSRDLMNWLDEGPLFVHPGPQAWHVLESPQMHKNQGTYHLFFTEEQRAGTWAISAPALTGPWTYGNRIQFDMGHAIEIYSIGNQLMLSRHDAFTFNGKAVFVIKFDDLLWGRRPWPVIEPFNPLDEWTTLSGNAFNDQPTFWDNTAARGAGPANFGGNSWIGTAEHYGGQLHFGEAGDTVGDTPTGAIRSPVFTLAGDQISFRIGGTNNLASCYVALYTSGIQRLKATGDGNETMDPVVWNVSAWMGQQAYIEIVDQSSTGHINVDEIVEEFGPAAVTQHDKPALAVRTLLHANVPNPFNPSTAIAFDVAAPGHASLAVFDARGRLVRSLVDRAMPAGTHRVVWDGIGDDGLAAPSGAYFYRLSTAAGPAQTRRMLLVK